ncbi:MAG: glycerophosphodiester phosphodiesterase family protein [Acholeplasmataceae bacterium]
MSFRQILKRSFLVIFILYVVLMILPKPQSVDGINPLRKTDRPLIIAHGGGNHEFPDNTLEAYYHAFSVDPNVMLETDVSLTKDGIVILSHDTTLDRKTTLTNARIIDINYHDLIEDEVDFGYHNQVVPNSNGFNVTGEFFKYENYLGQTVTPLDVTYPDGVEPRHETKFLATTLETLITAFPENNINVEIKQSGQVGLDALNAVIELMDALNLEYQTFDRIILASFHQEIFEAMQTLKKTTHPSLMMSPEQSGVITFYALHILRLNVFYKDPIAALQLPTEQFGINLSTKSIMRTAQRHNIAVHYWTIDDPEEMRRLILLGADGIMTNRPTLLKEIIDEIYG